VSREHALGTAWAQRIADWLTTQGFPYAERRVQYGANDKGDITGCPGLMIEAKRAARFELSEWWAEAVRQKANAKADVACVWFWRRGKASPGDAWVLMTGSEFVDLLHAAGYGTKPQPVEQVPGQLEVSDAI
jgi:hypothetical protein